MDATPLVSGTEGLGKSVTRVLSGGREFFIVGTAHVSKKSVDEVRRTISELRPDAVCVELDQSRYDALVDETRFRKLDALAVVREDRAGQMLASLLFSAFQKRLGDRLGARPGAEMLAAVDAAREISAEVVFGDRDVQITLRRCYASLGTLDRGKIIAALALLPFASAEVDEAEVERLKDRETISDAMSVFAEQMPALKTPLIDERDRYLASSMLGANGSKVVAVVGAAHVAGIIRNLEREIDRAALVTVPVRTRSPWAIVPLALSALVVALSVARGLPPSAITALFERLAFPTSACSAVFVLAAGGGLSAALTAGALAPVSLFLPVFPLGRVASVVQGRARPPSEDDAGAVRLDMLSPSRFRKNSFLLVLLVFIASRFGRTTGAFFGFLWVAIRLLHMR